MASAMLQNSRSPHGTLDRFFTATEAYSALERAFLAAETEIVASFLVFGPDTRLRSDEGLAVGQRWFDLTDHHGADLAHLCLA
ncbi:MAG: hypothetical protein ACK4RZ_09385 [Paracoccaceae bacterium]